MAIVFVLCLCVEVYVSRGERLLHVVDKSGEIL